MSKLLFKFNEYRSVHDQSLRNVAFFAPTIVWVQKGQKQILWQNEIFTFDNQNWLLIPANYSLCFINSPQQTTFFSRTLTLFVPPPSDWIISSVQQETSLPLVAANKSLTYCFKTLLDLQDKHLSNEAVKHYLYALYAELKRAKKLHLLFTGSHTNLAAKLSYYFLVNPSQKYSIAQVSSDFSMSKATLNRKLAVEKTTFHKVLTQVRMTYALSLLQQQQAPQNVALACGYQSTTRFAQRFKQQFGVSPLQYQQTLQL